MIEDMQLPLDSVREDRELEEGGAMMEMEMEKEAKMEVMWWYVVKRWGGSSRQPQNDGSLHLRAS
jgi:hypothetical protein